MRIGIDVTPLCLRSGGIPRYVEKLVAGLAEIDCPERFALCGPVEPAHLANLAPGVWRDRSGFPFEKLAKQIHPIGAGRLDLFHATNYLPPLLLRSPTVLTVHDLTVQLFPSTHGAVRRLRHRLLPSMCHRAARIIADSHSTKHDLVRLFGLPESKIDVVHLAAGEEFHPVSDPDERERVRWRYGLPRHFVLYLGDLNPRKGLEALVKAHARLRRHGCPYPLVLAGEGDPLYVQSLQSAARARGLELGEGLLMPGHVSESDLPALYSICDLFIYPSAYEGFGLPPLEAMACGAPVLVPDNSAFSELYAGSPMLFKLDSTESLVEAMDRALTSREWRNKLVESGLKQAELRSWSTVAHETLACYRRALRG
jgi:glycosyltransferase involved in cell wall biosynthesis